MATNDTGGLLREAPVGRARSEPDLTRYSGRVAARARALRERRGWSVPELAHKLDIGVQTVYGYENGKRDIPADRFPDFAAVFGLTVRAFLPNE